MLTIPLFFEIKHIGKENSELDIIYKTRDDEIAGINKFRGIQIKTLSCIGNGYVLNNLNNYNDNTVIVGVSNDRLLLCVFVKFEIKSYGDKLYINPAIHMEFKNCIFHGVNDKSLGYTFNDLLIDRCKMSTFYDNSNISISNLKEKESVNRIKQVCIENGIIFDEVDNNFSSIDCRINGKNIQCKYSERFSDNAYNFSIVKSKNMLRTPYDDEDGIDFFIFESAIGEFYVIPINIMIYFGYIRTKNNKGKEIIRLFPSNIEGFHWTKYFIGAFYLVKDNNIFDIMSILDMSNVINIFNYICYLNGIDSNRNMDNLSTKICEIGDKKIKCFESTKIAGLNYIYTIRSKFPYNILKDVDIPDYFVFYLKVTKEVSYFYIFPKQVLIDNKIIGDLQNKGSTDLGLPIPYSSTIRKNKLWTQQYVNNFDIFKI